MRILKLDSPETETILRAIEERRRDASSQAAAVADEAIEGVRTRGDAYVAEQILRFDKQTIAPSEILIRPGTAQIDPDLARAIDVAIERIESYHLPQKQAGYTWKRNGTVITQRVMPLRRVGIYVPGGRAVYISTLMMCAVPARIAGVRDIVVATTPSAAATPAFRFTCTRLGIESVYRAGGAAGVAALGIGTATVRRVDKIVGPGNSYVTAAKARLVGQTGIDMTAGPTELIVIADDSADAAIVAADLNAQAEHGADSAVICVCSTESLAAQVAAEAPVAVVFVGSPQEGIALANRLAPEHLSIQARNARALADAAEQCGAVYIGPASAPAAGDYVFGSNHVLPTAGSARFFSPLGVYDFVKRSNIVEAAEEDVEGLAEAGIALAELEGLPMHAASLRARLAVRRQP